MRRARRIVLPLVLAAPLAACAVGPDPVAPDLALPGGYTAALPDMSGPADAPWWVGFEDGTLNALVADALSDNLSVAAANARLDEALALIRAERSDLFPRIDGFGQASASTTLEGDRTSNEEALAGLDSTFVPDLFGRRRRELQAALAAARAEEFGIAEARRVIARQVVSTYLELRRTDARLALLENSLDLQNRTLEIVRLRAEAGLAADLDVQRALADLAQTRAQRGPLTASRVQADTLLAVLTARRPGDRLVAPREEAVVPAYADGPGVGVPADLLRLRPDIRVAESDLVAAIARIGAETADLYPALSLPGSITTDLGGNAVLGGTRATINAILDVPLFDAGRRRAEIRAAEARADAALANYERTLLDALREVEVALVAINSAQARRDDLAIAVEASERAFDQLQALYTEGLASLIDVLDAQRQLIASREAFVNSEASLASAMIDLQAALGVPVGAETWARPETARDAGAGAGTRYSIASPAAVRQRPTGRAGTPATVQ